MSAHRHGHGPDLDADGGDRLARAGQSVRPVDQLCLPGAAVRIGGSRFDSSTGSVGGADGGTVLLPEGHPADAKRGDWRSPGALRGLGRRRYSLADRTAGHGRGLCAGLRRREGKVASYCPCHRCRGRARFGMAVSGPSAQHGEHDTPTASATLPISPSSRWPTWPDDSRLPCSNW
jgi:hypothetical protein